jgi:hypothetical protein
MAALRQKRTFKATGPQTRTKKPSGFAQFVF